MRKLLLLFDELPDPVPEPKPEQEAENTSIEGGTEGELLISNGVGGGQIVDISGHSNLGLEAPEREINIDAGEGINIHSGGEKPLETLSPGQVVTVGAQGNAIAARGRHDDMRGHPIGIVTENRGDEVLVAQHGIAEAHDLVPGAPLYLDSDGEVTTTRPIGEVHQIGVAISTSQYLFNLP